MIKIILIHRGEMYNCLHCESFKTPVNSIDIFIFNENAHYLAKLNIFFFSFAVSGPRLLFLIQKQWLHFPWVRWLLSQQPRCFFNLSQRDFLNDDWNPFYDWIRDFCAMEITKTFFFTVFSDFWKLTDVRRVGF